MCDINRVGLPQAVSQSRVILSSTNPSQGSQERVRKREDKMILISEKIASLLERVWRHKGVAGVLMAGVCWYHVPVLDFDRLEEGRSLALDVRAKARPGVAHHHVNGRHVRPRLRLWLQTPGLVHGARALVPAGWIDKRKITIAIIIRVKIRLIRFMHPCICHWGD